MLSVCEYAVVVTNRPASLTDSGLPALALMIADDVPYQGPLGGLVSAFAAAKDEWVFAVVADMPCIKPEIVLALWELRDGADVVVPAGEKGYEPLLALYRVETCLTAARGVLANGRRRLVAMFPSLKVTEVPLDTLRSVDPGLSSLVNVNTPEDLAERFRHVGVRQNNNKVLVMMTDMYGRRIDYLRISLTDRCNLRCVYCMPDEGVAWKDHNAILAFEEIERFARIAVQEGICKIRITGGEPLVRRGVVDHIHRLREITGLNAIALTTNGTLLPRFARELASAGLDRVNISLDSLDPAVFARITRGGRIADVLAGLDAAFAVGFHPIKLNVVVVRSLRQDLLGFARMTIDRPLYVRFIEYMPIGEDARVEEGIGYAGHTAGFHWTPGDHVDSDEILATLTDQGVAIGLGELQAVARHSVPGGWGPAQYYRFPNAAGMVGVISPLSHHFCGECNRLRLTADGKLKTCLFSDEEIDVRGVLREGTDADVRAVIKRALVDKPENHNMRVGTARRMSQIGG